MIVYMSFIIILVLLFPIQHVIWHIATGDKDGDIDVFLNSKHNICGTMRYAHFLKSTCDISGPPSTPPSGSGVVGGLRAGEGGEGGAC